MRLVVADASPVRYLVPIGQIDLLPRLFEKIFLLRLWLTNYAIPPHWPRCRPG